MSLLPRTLFARVALLLLAVIVAGLAAALLLFRQDRADLLARQLGDTKIVQLQALQAALATMDPRERPGYLAHVGREFGVRLVPADARPMMGRAPLAPFMEQVVRRLTERLGEGTEVRVTPRSVPPMMWVRLQAGGTAYWAGFPIERPREDFPRQVVLWGVLILTVLLGAAFWFARRLALPLRRLHGAVALLGGGGAPEPLPEDGPAEVAELSRGFNRMARGLQAMERDRAMLLAGVSHDLRTPLARLRLGVEIAAAEPAVKQGMVDDIEEMDRVISQFLDFARGEDSLPTARSDLDALVAACAERFARKGRPVSFAAGGLPPIPLRPAAIERLLNNLVDNALRYGRPPVELSTRREGAFAVVDVADRGAGIPPGEVERLKQPFTRLDTARGGAVGSGLGLAIVERIARAHGGTFELLPREGGGTHARVRIPVERPDDGPAG